MPLIYTCPTCGQIRRDQMRPKATWDGGVPACGLCRAPVSSEAGFCFVVATTFREAGTGQTIRGTFTLDAASDEIALTTVRRAVEHHGPVEWVIPPTVIEQTA